MEDKVLREGQQMFPWRCQYLLWQRTGKAVSALLFKSRLWTRDLVPRHSEKYLSWNEQIPRNTECIGAEFLLWARHWPQVYSDKQKDTPDMHISIHVYEQVLRGYTGLTGITQDTKYTQQEEFYLSSSHIPMSEEFTSSYFCLMQIWVSKWAFKYLIS